MTIGVGIDAAEMAQTPDELGPCLDIVRRRVAQQGLLAFGQLDLERGRHRERDLVLHGEDVINLAVKPVRPHVAARLGIGELHGNSDPVGRLAQAPGHDVPGAKFLTDLLHRGRPSLEGEGRATWRHREMADLGEAGDEVFGDAIGQKILIRVRAHILERQNGQHRDIFTASHGRA